MKSSVGQAWIVPTIIPGRGHPYVATLLKEIPAPNCADNRAWETLTPYVVGWVLKHWLEENGTLVGDTEE